jgi:uncharacterized surface protein with fasciclin (FAS1) repeats
MNRWTRLLMAACTAIFLAACGGSDDDDVAAAPAPNIVQVAQANSQFSILVEAVVAANLQGTLSQPGPYTVFAPTDTAFAALLAELNVTKAQLLADRALLTQVLTYHVLPARVPRSGVPAGQPITTVQGGIFKVDAVNGGLVITDGRNRTANITATDVGASNGVIHVIDKVLLPANRTVVETAQANPQFSILVQAAVNAGLVPTLNGTGPFTVFAPTDAAFAALLTELNVTAPQLLANTALLQRVLTYHVVPGRVLRAQVPVGTPITTVQGGTFTVGTNLAITDARGRTSNIVATDVLASNGVIHVIDRVILPTP